MEKSTNNFCRLEGNIGSEIKISNLPNEEGTPVTNFSLAVNTFIKRNNELERYNEEKLCLMTRP